MRHVHITKYASLNSMSFEYLKCSTVSTFAVTHLHDRTIQSCSDSKAALLTKAVLAYLLNTTWPEGDIHCGPFHSAVSMYIWALHALVNVIRSFNSVMFLKDGFMDFLASEISLTRSIITIVFQILFNNKKLLVHKSGDRWNSREHQVLTRQQRGTTRIRNQILKSSTVVTLLAPAPAAADIGVVHSALRQDATTGDDVVTAALHRQLVMAADENTAIDVGAIKPVPSTHKRGTRH